MSILHFTISHELHSYRLRYLRTGNKPENSNENVSWNSVESCTRKKAAEQMNPAKCQNCKRAWLRTKVKRMVITSAKIAMMNACSSSLRAHYAARLLAVSLVASCDVLKSLADCVLYD